MPAPCRWCGELPCSLGPGSLGEARGPSQPLPPGASVSKGPRSGLAVAFAWAGEGEFPHTLASAWPSGQEAWGLGSACPQARPLLDPEPRSSEQARPQLPPLPDKTQQLPLCPPLVCSQRSGSATAGVAGPSSPGTKVVSASGHAGQGTTPLTPSVESGFK